LLIAVVACGGETSAPPAGAGASTPSRPGTWGREDAALTRLFTPNHAPPGTYRVEVTSERIKALAAARRAADPHAPAAAWTIARQDPLQVFDSSAPADRARLARLYAGGRVQVTRGPITRDGRLVESLTLLSPYPDAALSRLDPGTMVIVFRVPDEVR
jgi:hypothetical protein